MAAVGVTPTSDNTFTQFTKTFRLGGILMIQALDQTGDINGQQLYRLSRLYTLPDFVKKASSDAVYGDDQLENHQFADPTRRQFPCHTAASTYISTLFFMDKKAELDPERATYIEARLDDFGFLHGIGTRLNELKEKLASDRPRDNVDELPDDAFALILEPTESRSGARERHYPMRNALELKKCAEYLKEYRDEFPYKYRQKMASSILDLAQKYGAGLGDLDLFLEKTAGRGAAASYEVGKLLFDRARLLKRAGKVDYAIKMAELAKTVAGRPESIQDQDQLVKLACLVDDADRETGLNRLIEDLPHAEEVFFNITEKVASQMRSEHFATTSGNIYKLVDVDRLKLAEVRDLMGTEFAEAISTGGLFVSPEKVAEIVPTLPRGDAELFDRLMTTCGIHPMAKEAAHEKGGFDDADLKVLAKMHRR
jgi:hypothetical protein